MRKKLVLLDVDSTIFDRDYQLTVPETDFKKAIQYGQERGLSIGLSSDSGLATLSLIAKLYGLQGPIVAEKGGLVKILDSEIRVNDETEKFMRIRELMISGLASDSLTGSLLLIIGDVNRLSRSMLAIERAECYSKSAILINGLRNASLSFFVFANTGGKWVMDKMALDAVLSSVHKIGSRLAPKWWQEAVIDNNPDYGICIVHHPKTEKRNALPLLRKHSENARIYMVGDSISDLLNDPSVTHCAVKNASNEFKKQCSMIATKTMTQGVMEILDQIVASE
ncbi:MAG: hypothetical protein ABI430_02795 [Candidatus Taylorbacteria bacterium]